MKLVGNGSEKAKHHYKPSSGKPKTMRSQPFHTVPKLQLRSRKKKTQVKDRSTCTDTKMKLVGNGSEKAKHHYRPSSGKPKTQARKMLPVTFGIHKTFLLAPSLRGWVRNQYTATPNAVEEPMRSFRKPRTAASFVPKACKTQASKNASRYLWRP